MKFPDWPLHSTINKSILGLERIQKLLDILGNPEKKLPPVFHIAGTNGKGSTSAFIKYILEDAGYKVHRYTSPHLVEFNERIEISGKKITDEHYDELAQECKFVVEKHKLDVTYFEIITTIAFMAFARNEADATILEVGIGGRLDATNAIKSPLVSIITPISLDHTKILGNTLEKIAMEKFGIVKKNCNVIISKQTKDVEDLLYKNAKKLNCSTFIYGKDWTYKKNKDNQCIFEGFSKKIITPLPNLEGEHQITNTGGAIASLMCQNILKIDEVNIHNGIKYTQWPARLQNLTETNYKKLLNYGDEFYLDGCHNEDGIRVMKNWLEIKDKIDKRYSILIVCMLAKKDVRAFARAVGSAFDDIIIVSNTNEGYILADEFEEIFNNLGRSILAKCQNISEALAMAKMQKPQNAKRIVACGSLYFAGEILGKLDQ